MLTQGTLPVVRVFIQSQLSLLTQSMVPSRDLSFSVSLLSSLYLCVYTCVSLCVCLSVSLSVSSCTSIWVHMLVEARD